MSLESLIFAVLQETITKKGNKYCLIAGSGKNLGCYRSKSGASKREKQVNYFKHIKKEQSSAASIAGHSSPLGNKKRKENE